MVTDESDEDEKEKKGPKLSHLSKQGSYMCGLWSF
jgi:hypothetical protein